ncbi:hypothetical protein PC9H_010296 [Pleurotus ostreatus]|uniref:Uncharacterized protein n=1 Tax=Pleurotus ostreatus TaxID=5322 RepID=A0A8H6ZVD0_PLEOS|nr:uncharacterized protein PC9H_010296 [Pleurotus ostreatus]KAF7424985.1 hypothetical protein PC9H_010296 [Pleurotus ostreatus]
MSYSSSRLYPHQPLQSHPSHSTNPAQRPTSSHSSRPSTQQSGFSSFSAAPSTSSSTTTTTRQRRTTLSVNCNEENGDGESPISGNANWGYPTHTSNAHEYAYNPNHPHSHHSSSHLNSQQQHQHQHSNANHTNGTDTTHPSAPSHEFRRRDAEQRASTLRSDELIRKVEPHRVFCNLCEKWVQLKRHSPYCAYPWRQHREKCIARHQRRMEKEAAIANMRAHRPRASGRSMGMSMGNDMGMGQELGLDADGDADAYGEVDADGDVDTSVPMTNGSQGGRGGTGGGGDRSRDEDEDGEGDADDLDLESEEGVEGGSGDEHGRRRKRRRMSNGLGVGVGANGIARGANGKHVSGHPLGGTRGVGMYGNGNGNGSMNGGGGPMMIDELGAEGEDDVDAEGEPYSEDQIVRTYSPLHYAHQQQHQHQQQQQQRQQYNRRQGGQGGQGQGMMRMGSGRGSMGGYSRWGGQPVALADLDSLPGRRNFIFLAIDHLFCTTYENSDDMTISSLLIYLNAAMPPDKHEDFDTPEVVKAVAVFKEKGKVIFEGDTLRLVD